MQTDQILDVLTVIAGNPGKKFKEEQLRAADCPELRRVLTAALDPLYTYGINKLPTRDDSRDGQEQFDGSTWVLIEGMRLRQITGGAMLQAVADEMSRLSPKSADLLGRILIKDLKAGFGDNTTNKAIPGLIREFPYMRCSLPKGDKLNKIEWAAGVISQEKADGQFMNVNHVAGGLVMMFTRAGTMFPNEPFGAMIDEIRAAIPADYQAHGELLVKKNGVILPREDGNGILTSVAQGGVFEADEVPFLMLWDLVPLEAIVPKGKHKVGYLARFTQLVGSMRGKALAQVTVIPTKIVKSKAEAYAHYRELLAKGKEGTIIKLRDAIWKDGTSTEQFKLKLEADVDLQIKAIVPGKENGKNKGRPGSLTCVTSCGQLVVDVTVKNEAMRDQVEADPNDWLERVITVRANAVMKPGDSSTVHSLFLPRMVEAVYRIDKNEPDSLQRVLDQYEAAVAAA
jgi:DNA ligase-1